MQGVIGNFLHNDQIFRAECNIFTAIFPINHHVLNADTKFARQIDARLCRSHGTQRHGLCVSGVGIGCLMNLQTKAVTIAMAKLFTVSGILNHFSCHAIDFPAGNTRSGGLNGCQLGF